MLDIVIAVVIDWIIGDPYWFPHPVIYIGKLIKMLDKLGRKLFKQNKKLRIWGGFIVIIVCSFSFLIPFTILELTKKYYILHHIINILILWTTIAARSLHKEGGKVYTALKNRDIKDARLKLSYIVGRETETLSEKEVIRADIETIAENSSDGIIAPLFFGILGGAPLAMMYKGVNTMDSMLGYINEKYKYIGFFPAKVDDVFNFIPARITGFFMCLISPIIGGNIFYSFKIMFRDRKNHKSPNCAYPEAAAAAANGIMLGGNNVYFGEIMKKPTIGDMKYELEKKHIKRTIILMYASEILFIILYVLYYIVLYIFKINTNIL
ncbi:adenosylcobinamide-phosphate synthase CbiB [Clostridium felsineum]|uniref:adenosylcobinamide-phosphate synthase CbiB n=1 Tax=Clostridium felsineum TaxID=36839 RepID=UPI00214D55AD|nr:adenosylcobinamide-phosphate synthase CbiB [Clostridium felsineum]MCR3758757.1 adenosylcobinamide-phosphate synthase CbiB [Clostridium felsineum]